MENKDRYFKALIENKNQLNEIDLGEKIQLDENETREIITQLLSEHRIRYDENSVCNYRVINKRSR
ncbi:hypothetical protein [Maribacter sp. 1_MG-2023]|uniref:hypothetical protein n=1 Tax=Maribacter sp. 1_MG-2023 TaxID=3062677 RepID=UPI0026E2BE3C|nr:hypothetical protein [Maribacter sp. 1_MG-2023]MDO6471612.1 hypothetical protein [Maribacter sp. 1_MG-2023]